MDLVLKIELGNVELYVGRKEAHLGNMYGCVGFQKGMYRDYMDMLGALAVYTKRTGIRGGHAVIFSCPHDYP